MNTKQSPLKDKVTTCLFNLNEASGNRLRQALLSASKDDRIKEVMVTTTKREYGFKKGSHKLAAILSDLAGDVEPKDNIEGSYTLLGDEDCSHLEVLSNMAAILHQMAGTPWLAIKKVEVISTDVSALKNGQYDSQDLLKELANMTDVAFTAKMQDKKIDFRNTVAI